ncbi:MAG: hypothetical protein QM802_17985 [Agriterribacter sp.]
MDRLILKILPFLLCACSYYNKNSKESRYFARVYFGDKYTIRFYSNVFDDYAYWKVYDKNDRELYQVNDETLLSIGIDSLKNDTLFGYRIVAGNRKDTNSQYRLVDESFLKIFLRKSYQFGAANSKDEKVSFLGRKLNTVYLKKYDTNVLDTVNLNNIFFMGKDVFMTQELSTNDGLFFVTKKIIFPDITTQKNFFESFDLNPPISEH